MTKRKDDTELDLETLRLGIERCDPDLLLDYYADDARLGIVSADAPHASPFELSGKLPMMSREVSVVRRHQLIESNLP